MSCNVTVSHSRHPFQKLSQRFSRDKLYLAVVSLGGTEAVETRCLSANIVYYCNLVQPTVNSAVVEAKSLRGNFASLRKGVTSASFVVPDSDEVALRSNLVLQHNCARTWFRQKHCIGNYAYENIQK